MRVTRGLRGTTFVTTLCAMPLAGASYLWSRRPLVVFAASAADPKLVEQRRILSPVRSGFLERDVVIVWVVGDTVRAEPGPAPGRSATALRATYGATAQEFRTVLVGKDGAVKLAQARPFSSAALFATIDAMPMRRDEMRQR